MIRLRPRRRRKGLATQAKPAFVLVHGGTHGGWCWSRVAGRLRAAEHLVFTPTMTGLGERYHLTGPSVNLDTHIQDLVGVLEWEDLRETVLVAHSYGGYPVTGAVDRIPERVGQIIYLDALIGRSGTALFDLAPPETTAEKIATAHEVGGGMVLAGLDVERYGITDPGDRGWVTERITPQPLSTYTTRLRLEHPVGNGKPCSFIRCTQPRLASVEESHQFAGQVGLSLVEITAGHDAMVTAPAELSDLLLMIVSRNLGAGGRV
jgi:pimeloyl-ACP methyl ester carboxylesterase